MSEPEYDPFSQVYNALWKLVERNQRLSRYIPAGNRIKYEEAFEQKTQISDADTPELALLSGGGTFGDRDTNTGRTCSRDYIWALTTGNLQLNKLFNPIQFELFRSLSDWQCVLCELQWCNCRFVHNLHIVSAEDGTLMADLNRNIPGWSSLWTVRIEFQFSFANLKII